jgi:opacity protein-like surface antigen
MKTFLMTVAAAMMISGGAQALVVNEGADFEASGIDASTFDVGTFGAGSHRITGTVSGDCTLNAPGSFFVTDCYQGADRQDNFKFTIGAGHELVGMSVDNEKGGTASEVIFELFMRTTGMMSTNIISLGQGENPQNSSTDLTAAAGTLGAGEYMINYFGLTSATAGTYQGFWGVNLDIRESGPTTPSVPLPASLPLLLAGMGALGIARRKRG